MNGATLQIYVNNYYCANISFVLFFVE